LVLKLYRFLHPTFLRFGYGATLTDGTSVIFYLSFIGHTYRILYHGVILMVFYQQNIILSHWRPLKLQSWYLEVFYIGKSQRYFEGNFHPSISKHSYPNQFY